MEVRVSLTQTAIAAKSNAYAQNVQTGSLNNSANATFSSDAAAKQQQTFDRALDKAQQAAKPADSRPATAQANAAANAAAKGDAPTADAMENVVAAANAEAAKDVPTPNAVNATDATDDAASDAVTTGKMSALLAAMNAPSAPVVEIVETEVQPDPIADPVEGLAALEKIGEEAEPPKAIFVSATAAALDELLPAAGRTEQAAANQSLLNQLAGRYEGEIALTDAIIPLENPAQAVSLETAPATFIGENAAAIDDGLLAVAAQTAPLAREIASATTEDKAAPTIVSRTDLVVDNQMLDTTPVTALANAQMPAEMAQNQEGKSSTGEQMKQAAEADALLKAMNDRAAQSAANAAPEIAAQAETIRPGEASDSAAIDPAAIATPLYAVAPQPIEAPMPTQEAAPTAEPQQIRQQIVEQARLIRTGESTEMVISLKPENLGHLVLRISVANDGAVTASFQSQNAQVRAAIESSMLQLKQDLADAGLKVDSVNVSTGFAEDFFAQGQMGGQQMAGQSFGQSQPNARDTQLAAQSISAASSGVESAAASSPISGQPAVSTNPAAPINNAGENGVDYRI